VAKAQVEDQIISLTSALLKAVLPMCRYIVQHGNAEDRRKLRKLTGSAEYEEIVRLLGQMRR